MGKTEVTRELEFGDHPDGGYFLTTEMVIEESISDVFAFFSDACNLEAITPPWLNFKILTPMPLVLEKNSLLDYSIRLHGIPIKWRTEICEWNAPYHFADQQLRGPYKRWYHRHTFADLGDHRTLMTDHVHYIPRGGSLIHRFLVKPDLKKIFEYRQEKLAEFFAEGTIRSNANAAQAVLA